MGNKGRIIKIENTTIGVVILFSLFLLLYPTGVYADNNAIDEVTVTVPTACSITSTINTAHTATVEVGTYEDEIGETTFKVLCNDANGFAVYAIGYGDDSYGNTTMKPATLPIANGIATGTATSGGTSNWAMKLTTVSGDYAPTLATGFNAYHAVPNEYTKVASLNSNTDAVSGSSFKSTYAVYISQAQAADTYTGKVKYTVMHPSNTDAPDWRENMQNLGSSSCTTTPTQVKDIRDGHIYTIQRLLDGKCWMMENLDLGRTNLTTDLTSSNTNLSTTITAAMFNSWKKTSGTGTFGAGELITLTSSNTVNGLDTDPTSGTPYGTLYNYFAASAGTISGDNNSSDAQYDICPAGWRLPTGGWSGDFQKLISQYGNSYASLRSSITENGVAFALSGYFTIDPVSQGRGGYYWSSSIDQDSDQTMTNFVIGDGPTVLPAGSMMRYQGLAIRCILKDPMTISDLTYMQDFDSLSINDKTSVLASMEDNTTYYLVDNRDDKTYAVAKMLDDKIWMTENLDLGETALSVDLTSTNTNLANTVTAETFNSWKKTSGTATNSAGELASVSGTDSVSGTPYGTLYNYYAATAGTISGDTNNSNAEYDICPAGWRLPTGGPSGELQALYTEYNSNILMRKPVAEGGAAFALAGYLSLLTEYQGASGYYWSSTRNDNASMYLLYLDANYINPTNYIDRRGGNSIRCVIK